MVTKSSRNFEICQKKNDISSGSMFLRVLEAPVKDKWNKWKGNPCISIIKKIFWSLALNSIHIPVLMKVFPQACDYISR